MNSPMNCPEISVRIRYHARRYGQAFCGSASITLFNCFIIRGLKILSLHGKWLVAMPDFKLQAPCPYCKKSCALDYKFCPGCGRELPEVPVPVDAAGRPELYRDIAHPLTHELGEYIQKAVIDEYLAGLQRIANLGITKAESTEENIDGASWKEESYFDWDQWDIDRQDRQSLGLLNGECAV